MNCVSNRKLSMDNLLPPGYRFYPTEEELVSFYLHNKLENTRDDLDRVIPILDIYQYDPSDLPHHAGDLCHGYPEQWFFFIPRQESEERGGRPRRLTDSGYWKATGSPGYVYSSNHRIIGEKKTMVFYEGRAPNGSKTEWKMNEYKAIDGEALSSTTTFAHAPLKLRQEFSVNRVYKKSKSLTTFDRRPLAVNRPAIIQDDHQTTTASARILMQQRTPSPLDSSSSGDHHHHHHHSHCLPQPQTVEAHCGSSIMGMHQATTASPIISMPERTTSLDTLSSGDHNHHHHNHCHSQSQTVEAHAGSSTMGMHAIDDTDELELDWEHFAWEHFDWDYDMQ